jgi:hypothetical protein
VVQLRRVGGAVKSAKDRKPVAGGRWSVSAAPSAAWSTAAKDRKARVGGRWSVPQLAVASKSKAAKD